jgi:hypothetical protein
MIEYALTVKNNVLSPLKKYALEIWKKIKKYHPEFDRYESVEYYEWQAKKHPKLINLMNEHIKCVELMAITMRPKSIFITNYYTRLTGLIALDGFIKNVPDRIHEVKLEMWYINCVMSNKVKHRDQIMIDYDYVRSRKKVDDTLGFVFNRKAQNKTVMILREMNKRNPYLLNYISPETFFPLDEFSKNKIRKFMSMPLLSNDKPMTKLVNVSNMLRKTNKIWNYIPDDLQVIAMKVSIKNIKNFNHKKLISKMSYKEKKRLIWENGLLIFLIDKPSVELCMIAVKQNGLALRYIDTPTHMMCIEAVKQNPYSIVYVFKQTYAICECVFEKDSTMILLFEEKYQDAFV